MRKTAVAETPTCVPDDSTSAVHTLTVRVARLTRSTRGRGAASLIGRAITLRNPNLQVESDHLTCRGQTKKFPRTRWSRDLGVPNDWATHNRPFRCAPEGSINHLYGKHDRNVVSPDHLVADSHRVHQLPRESCQHQYKLCGRPYESLDFANSHVLPLLVRGKDLDAKGSSRSCSQQDPVPRLSCQGWTANAVASILLILQECVQFGPISAILRNLDRLSWLTRDDHTCTSS